MLVNDYGFDPTYGYSLAQLLAIAAPKMPADFENYWRRRYQKVLSIDPQPRVEERLVSQSPWQVFLISYTSSGGVLIRGWLLVPRTLRARRAFIIGHGYGGRSGPDFNLPFTDAVMLFPCFRGLSLSALEGVPSNAYGHVLQGIAERDSYILGGCVDDLWSGVGAILSWFPHLQGHLGFLGISFAGGIGALALPWDKRIARAHLNVPTFGDHPLRLRLPTLGSTHSLQLQYCQHKKATLRVLRYFDAALAARFIAQAMHCACALSDPSVAPPGQFAIYNQITSAKQLMVLLAGHQSYPEQAEQEQLLLQELDSFFKPLSLTSW